MSINTVDVDQRVHVIEL